MLLPLALGFGLGLSLAAPPGPMNALIAREASRHGAAAGIRMGIAAPVADTVYLVVLLAGAELLVPSGSALQAVAWIGAAIIASFAYSTWFPAPPGESGPVPTRFGAAFAAAMTNPYQIAWWFTGGFLFLQSQGWIGIIGLMLGIFGWVLAFSWLMAHGARRWRWFEPTVRIASAAVLSLFTLVLFGVAMGFVTP